jgi:hypothetical protein
MSTGGLFTGLLDCSLLPLARPHPAPLQKAAYAFIDSETSIGFLKNVKHSGKHGCFCFGLFFATAASEDGGGAKYVIMRYNRWGDGGVDLVPYWAAVQA